MGQKLLVTAMLASALLRAGRPGIAMSGPAIGLVLDPASGSLRPLRGLPGAATLGEPLHLDFTLAQAVPAPRQNAVLAVSAGEARVYWIRMLAGEPAAVPLAGAAAAPDGIFFSPSGSVAALYYAGTGEIELVRGFPSAPAVTARIDVSSLPGRIAALAVSDDAGALLAAVTQPGAAPVYLLSASAGPRMIFAAHRVSSIAFAPGRHDALLTDDLDDRVYMVSDVAATAGVTYIAGPEDGIAGPLGTAVSDDAARVYVANARSRTVTAIDLAGGAPAVTLACGCALSGIHRIGGDAFTVTEVSGRPLWVLDAGPTRGRLFFIPPARAAQ